VKLSLENRAARPVAYVRRRNVRASPASRTMLLTGLLVFAFIVYHLLHFTLFAVRPEYARLTDGAGRHDVYAMVVLSFRNPAVSAAYAAAMAVLALHLSHAVASMAQTWGFAEGRLAGLRGAGAAVSWAIFAGYVSIPAACLLGWVPLPAGAGS
jgi:succinate dehydrogenase / fumarate reductase cytochrome b subunit